MAIDSEPEVSVGAALELVDELGLDELCEELSGETIGTVPIVAESPKRGNQEGHNENDAPSSVKKTAKKEKNSGFHQREELGYLRIKVEKLQDQLAALQYAKVAKQLRRASSSPDDVGDGEDAREELVWKDVAARQNQQRQLSEAENVRLRGMLEQQIHVAQSLERLLKKRTNVELFPPLPSKRVRMSTPLDNPDLLDEDTLALYHSLNEVIASRFPDGETTLRDVDVKNDAITGTSLEAMDVRVVPFDYLMTATASWHRFTVSSDLARQFVLEEVKLTEDRVSMDFKGAPRPDISSELHGRIVMRQFVETDRIVIIWSALINPLHVCNTPFDGVVMRYKGVQVMEELPSTPSMTQMRSLHMVIPQFYREVENRWQQVGTLTEFVLSLADLHLETGHAVLDNVLIDHQRVEGDN